MKEKTHGWGLLTNHDVHGVLILCTDTSGNECWVPNNTIVLDYEENEDSYWSVVDFGTKKLAVAAKGKYLGKAKEFKFEYEM